MATTVKTDNTPHRKNAYAGTGAPKAHTKKSSKKARSGKRGSRRKTLTWIGIILCVIAIAAAAVALPYFTSGARQAAVIKIPRHADTRMLADTLTKYFGESYSRRTAFIFSRLASDPAQRYGAYEIPMGTSPFAAARRLARGAQMQVKLTINGVREFDDFIPRIAAKFDFSAADLRKALSDPATLRPYSLTPEQAPALFLNDTYLLYWNTTPEGLIGKLGENYLAFWNDENKAKAQAMGVTPAEVVTIASIADEETAKSDEKGRIGRLYINRYRKGMKLQADPTVKFALKDFSIRRITQKHIMQAPAPYNTYRAPGIPPGPIRTTSTATLREILDSKPSDDIYMCAKEDFSGYHNFSSTYDQHLQNAKRYQQALNERGIN